MRGWKIAAAAVGVIIAFFVVMSVVHIILGLAFDVLVAALVAGGVYVAIKMARSGKQVSGKAKDKQLRDEYPEPALPRTDVEQYSAPRTASRPSASDVDDELARLKREMGS